jgi:pentatricopeptide repeat protein
MSTLQCELEGCTKRAESGGTQHCKAHGGGRRCQREGCTKAAAGAGTPHCLTHGGGKRCQEKGCTNPVGGGVGGTQHCIPHGGGLRCQQEGCSALLRKWIHGHRQTKEFCKAHGGGMRCLEEGCSHAAAGSTQHCVAHGGGRRCQVKGCFKAARGGTQYFEMSMQHTRCMRHCITRGGARRCQHKGCSNPAVAGGSSLCIAHCGARRCQHEGCSNSARFARAHCGGRRFCKAHCGGRRCQHKGCSKPTVAGGSHLCIAHCGARRSQEVAPAVSVAVATAERLRSRMRPRMAALGLPGGLRVADHVTQRAPLNYKEMVTAAVVSLKDKPGSSQKAIVKYIKANYTVPEKTVSKRCGAALKKLVENHLLAKDKASFKLPVKAKKEATNKKPAAKKPAAKKPAAKKPAKSPVKAKTPTTKPAKKSVVPPDVSTYNALICAHETDAQGERAMAVLEDMQAAGVQPDRSTDLSTKHLLRVLWQSGQRRAALDLCGKAAEAGVYPLQAERTLNKIDLHDMVAGAVEAATTLWLAEIAAASLERPASLPATFTIITGRGRHSRVTGKSEVKDAVTAFLQALNSPFQKQRDNPGRMIADQTAVCEWLAGLGPIIQRVCDDDKAETAEAVVAELDQPTVAAAAVQQQHVEGESAAVDKELTASQNVQPKKEAGRRYKAFLSAYWTSGQRERAMELLEEMKKAAGMQPDFYTHSFLINAYAKSAQWERAMEACDAMKAAGMHPARTTYDDLINVLWQSGQRRTAVDTYKEAADAGVYPLQAERTLNKIDLHHAGEGVAQAATTLWLGEIAAASLMNLSTALPEMFEVITGPRMKDAVTAFLQALNSPFQASNNPGRLVADRTAVREWLGARRLLVHSHKRWICIEVDI